MSNTGARRSLPINSAPLVFETSDPRADGSRRRICVESGRVTIARRLAGMRMVLTVPANAYRGVALLRSQASEQGKYRLRLEHRDTELDVPLGETESFTEALALHAAWAAFFGLPQLSAADPKRAPAPAAMAPAERRLSRTVAARRPRFLARRKPGLASPGADRPE